MEHKALIRLLTLLLVFSFILSLDAVPLSRILKSAQLVEQGMVEQSSNDSERLEEDEGFEMNTRRMDVESNDYPGTGANNHHDPNPPGRS